MCIIKSVPHSIDTCAILQVQQQRVTELTLELQETNHKLDECRAQKDAADQRITEMTQELENSAGEFSSGVSCYHRVLHGILSALYHVQCTCNTRLQTLLLLLGSIGFCQSTTVVAVVFKMHYSELLSKEDEIARLKAIIEGLSTNR